MAKVPHGNFFQLLTAHQNNVVVFVTSHHLEAGREVRPRPSLPCTAVHLWSDAQINPRSNFWQNIFFFCSSINDFQCVLYRGEVVSWLVRLPPGRAVRVRVLAKDILFCYWTIPLILSQYLSLLRCIFGYMGSWYLKILSETLQWASILSEREGGGGSPFTLQKPR